METVVSGLKLLGAWLLFAAVIWLFYKFLAWFGNRLATGPRIRTRIKGATGAAQILWYHSLRIVLSLVRLAVLAVVLIFLSLVLSYSFSLFEPTRGISVSLWEALNHAAATIGSSFADFLPNLAFLTVIALIGYYLNKVLRIVFRGIERGDIHIAGFYPDWAEPTYELGRFLLIVFSIVVAFPYLPGSQSGALQGVSIFFGVLISFGSTSAVSNVVAGVFLTYMRPFQIGDRVKVGDTVGDIVERNLLVTRIRSIKNESITVPNANVLSAAITNYSAEARTHGLIIHSTVTIGYDVPWRTVHELLINAALSTTGVLSEPRPFVFQTALNDYNVSYQINAYTDRPNDIHIISPELNQNIQESFNAGGVEIMSPAYFALRDGNTVTIPEPQRPAGYRPPAFRVERNP